MPCSSQDIFAWTGAVLINISFIFGITWGTFTTWYFGAALTAIYSALLFGGARGLERRQQRQQRQQQEAAPATDDDQVSTSNSSVGGSKTLLISLLYGQAILAMGVTGFFIPINLVGTGCYIGPSYTYGDDSFSFSTDVWVPNTTGIASPSVLAWMDAVKKDPYYEIGAPSTFVHLPDINTTVFSGVSSLDNDPEDDDEYPKIDEVLYISTAGAAPQMYGEFRRPGSMVAVTDSRACFRAFFGKSSTDTLICYDGQTAQAFSAPIALRYILEIRAFEDDDEDIVWYLGYPDEREGRIFLSVDVNSNTTTVHSMLTDISMVLMDDAIGTDDFYNDDQLEDCPTSTTRVLALCLLLASAIPVFVASILLWRAKSISSTGLTSFVGFIAAYSMLVTIVAPSTFFFSSYAHAVGWLICGAVCCLAYLPVAVFDQSTPTLRWGATSASVCYLAGLCSLLFFLPNDASVVSWVVFLVIGSVPLSLLGLVSDSLFMTFLGAGVAFASSIRLCIALGDVVNADGDINASFFLVVFASLAVTGLLVGGVGYMLGKYKQAIKQGLASALSPLEGRVKALMGGAASDPNSSATVQQEVALPASTDDAEK